MKMKLLVMIAVLGWSGVALAGTSTFSFDSHARLPEATSFSCELHKYNAVDPLNFNDDIDLGTSAEPDFGDLIEAQDASGNGLGWFKAQGNLSYFKCVLKPVGGVGIPTVTFTTTPGANPNQTFGAPYNARGGLDKKGVFTVTRSVKNPTTGQVTENVLGNRQNIFGNVGPSFNVSSSEVYGGWLNFYFGLAYYNAAGNISQAGAEVFNALDHYGDYYYTITATVTW